MGEQTISSISAELDKAIGEMNKAKEELKKKQDEVQLASSKYNESIDNVHMLKDELNKLFADKIPGLSTSSRIRVAG